MAHTVGYMSDMHGYSPEVVEAMGIVSSHVSSVTGGKCPVIGAGDYGKENLKTLNDIVAKRYTNEFYSVQGNHDPDDCSKDANNIKWADGLVEICGKNYLFIKQHWDDNPQRIKGSNVGGVPEGEAVRRVEDMEDLEDKCNKADYFVMHEGVHDKMSAGKNPGAYNKKLHDAVMASVKDAKKTKVMHCGHRHSKAFEKLTDKLYGMRTFGQGTGESTAVYFELNNDDGRAFYEMNIEALLDWASEIDDTFKPQKRSYEELSKADQEKMMEEHMKNLPFNVAMVETPQGKGHMIIKDDKVKEYLTQYGYGEAYDKIPTQKLEDGREILQVNPQELLMIKEQPRRPAPKKMPEKKQEEEQPKAA